MTMTEDWVRNNWKVPPQFQPRKWPEPSPQIMRQLQEDRAEATGQPCHDPEGAYAPRDDNNIEPEAPIMLATETKTLPAPAATTTPPAAPATPRRPRRQWGAERKAEIMAQLVPGVSLAEVAARNDISVYTLTAWHNEARKAARQHATNGHGKGAKATPANGMSTVVVPATPAAAIAPAKEPSAPPSPAAIEIKMPTGVLIRIPARPKAIRSVCALIEEMAGL